MEDIFGSDSSANAIIQKKLDLTSIAAQQPKSIQDLDFYFDVDQVVGWIKQNEFKRVSFVLNV